MVVITVRVVGGGADRMIATELDLQITSEELSKELEERTLIPSKFQGVEWHEELLPAVPHPLQSIKDGEELVTKHSSLPLWLTLLGCESDFKQANEKDLKKSTHITASGLVKTLQSTGLFIIYPSLGIRCVSMEKKFITYLDRKVEAIKDACVVHFKKLYGEGTNIAFGSRQDDSRSGCICPVESEGTITRFFVKTHHGAGDKRSNTHQNLDLKELFVYKFLQDLKIGAEVQFVESKLFTKWIIYLASREVSGFRTLERVELLDPQSVPTHSKAAVQMLVVFSILVLDDHHAANLSLDDSGNPKLVDLAVHGKLMTNCTDMYHMVRMVKEFNKHLGTFEERIQILLEYLKSSNFLATLDNSFDSFIKK